MSKKIFTWDLGGTKCHAGIVDYNETTKALSCLSSHTIKLSEATSLENLIHQFETHFNLRIKDLDAVCIGAAGQYDGEMLQHEHAYPFPMPFAAIAKQQQWPAYAVIHDYAPIVCATFTDYMHLPGNIKRLNQCALNPLGRRVALGIGTGLGLKDGVLLPNGDFWLGKNEIGHIGIATPPHANQEELKRHQELIQFLNHQPLTFETILSGSGITRLYEFLHPSAGPLTPEQAGTYMHAGSAPEVLALFAWYTGLFIGTTQLIFMPEGGIWITGGVALHLLNAFDLPEFNQGIQASPAYQPLRETYPLGVMCNQNHALLGNGYYAVKRLLTNDYAVS